MTIEIGDRVRTHDFNLPETDPDFYYEGVVLELNTKSIGCPCENHIKIMADKRVWDGEEKPNFEPEEVWNLMNGTQDLTGILNPVRKVYQSISANITIKFVYHDMTEEDAKKLAWEEYNDPMNDLEAHVTDIETEEYEYKLLGSEEK